MIGKVKKIISCICFLIILACFFDKVTWLFREPNALANKIIGSYDNEKEKMDVVLYGGSGVYNFYYPLVAWDSYGITSCNYATPGYRADMLKFYIEDSRKTKKPELYIVDIRILSETTDKIESVSLRNWSDSVDVFSIVRWKAITSYIFSRDYNNSGVLSYYLDIIKYHTNTKALSNSSAWQNAFQRKKISDTQNGGDAKFYLNSFDKTQQYDKESELTEIQKKSMTDLLDYCEKENLNVLFIAAPWADYTEEAAGVMNSAGKMIEERGYNFVNMSDYVDDIGIDFETDYNDWRHVNYSGMMKYTAFLSEYIVNNCGVTDHRGDPEYSQWDKDYASVEDTLSSYDEKMTALIEKMYRTKEIGESLPEINDFDEWYSLMLDGNFSMIIQADGISEWQLDDYWFNKMMYEKQFDMTDDEFVTIWTATTVNLKASDKKTASGEFGNASGKVKYKCTRTDGEKTVVTVNEKEYTAPDNGIRITVFNNEHRQLTDSIVVTLDEGNHLVLTRDSAGE